MREFFAAENDDDREDILEAMPQFDDPTTIPFFAAIARDSVRYSVRVRARGVIGLNLRDCTEAVRILWEVAHNDPDPSIRFLAIEGMGTNTACREEILPLLLSALGDEEPLVRQGAVAGLQFLGDPRAVGPIAAWIERQTDARLAADVVWMLGKYEVDEATVALRAIASGHRDEGVRERAWEELFARGDEAAIERRRRETGEADEAGLRRKALVETLAGEDGGLEALQLQFRAGNGDAEALASLEDVIDAGNPAPARFHAAAAIVREEGLPRGGAEACLRELARESKDAEVRIGALTELFYAKTGDGLALCESAAREGGDVGAHALALIEAHGLYGGRRDEAERALLRLLGTTRAADESLARLRNRKTDPEVAAWVRREGLPPRRLLQAGDPVARALLHR